MDELKQCIAGEEEFHYVCQPIINAREYTAAELSGVLSGPISEGKPPCMLRGGGIKSEAGV